MANVRLGTIYIHKDTGHRLRPYRRDVSAGKINERIHAHNISTGDEETWNTRLFLAEHVREDGKNGSR